MRPYDATARSGSVLYHQQSGPMQTGMNNTRTNIRLQKCLDDENSNQTDENYNSPSKAEFGLLNSTLTDKNSNYERTETSQKGFSSLKKSKKEKSTILLKFFEKELS